MLESIPPILYKYRDWRNKWHRRLLVDRELYFPSADQLNDPFDCFLPFQIDKKSLTAKDVLDYYQDKVQDILNEDLKNIWNELSESNQFYYLSKYLQSRYFVIQMSKKIILEIRDNFGIFCLSSKKDNILMWSHYSNCHKGFCIGFNTEELKKNHILLINPIKYPPSGEYPLVKFTEFSKRKFKVVKDLTHTKSFHWRYESEFRIIAQGYARKTLQISRCTVKEIILGCMMETPYQLGIIEYIRNNLPDVCIYEATLNELHFKLDLLPIYNCSLDTPIKFFL